MNNAELEEIAGEFERALTGGKFGRIFPLSRFAMAIDLRLSSGEYLFISAEPSSPRIHLIKRRLKELEKQAVPLSPFLLVLKKSLSGGDLVKVSKLPGERVLNFQFSVLCELEGSVTRSLVVQLTGRSSNVFLTAENGSIVERLRVTSGVGQTIGTEYAPPSPVPAAISTDKAALDLATDKRPLSQRLDDHFRQRDESARLTTTVENARRKIRAEIEKKEKLKKHLHADIRQHGDAQTWKRFGDLLLANSANARRDGGDIFVIDFFDENTPEIAIPGASEDSISEIAEGYFKRYTKSRNAGVEIERRLVEIDEEIAKLRLRSDRLETDIESGNTAALFGEDVQKKISSSSARKQKQVYNGAREFLSSDGYEILVGKKAKDNDFLTFRVAKSLDLWLHAADYPGSHVVVRNHDRKEIPHSTLIEAAQLAAFYSHAREQPKAAVNYTQKKFVNKPRGAAAGLVRLASFKTILVVPQVPQNKNAT